MNYPAVRIMLSITSPAAETFFTRWGWINKTIIDNIPVPGTPTAVLQQANMTIANTQQCQAFYADIGADVQPDIQVRVEE